MAGYKFASAVSTQDEPSRAITEVLAKLAERLPTQANLLLFFCTDDYIDRFSEVPSALLTKFPQATVLGVTGESVLCGDKEFEEPPALVVWGAYMPGMTLQAFHLEFAKTPEGPAFLGWPDELALEPFPAGSSLMLLGDPFSFPADVFVHHINQDKPGVPVFGGMASAGHSPRTNRLGLGHHVYDSGAVALCLHGPARVNVAVSQGCRPLGSRYVVTKAERNVIQELGGKPALEQLNLLIGSLGEPDRQLVAHGLHLGIAMNEYQETFKQGDYLIRHVMGVEKSSQSIVVGDYVRPGQTVQFHVRDAASADNDLRHALSQAEAVNESGALVFTCNGRGQRMFDVPHHDASVVCEAIGNHNVGGFFCAGELGPVAAKNFLHGFTASTVIFGSPKDSAE